MTDATHIEAEPTQIRRVSDYLSDGLRHLAGALARLPGRVGELRTEMRDEEDFEKIHKALSTLNKRQLAMLGMKREEIYTFAETCVYQPERRPALHLHQEGPVLALHAPETQKALEYFAPLEETAGAVAETTEQTDAATTTAEAATQTGEERNAA
ncbi:MAG: hypothetical protein AAF577_08475 [Pseudomonadota bacterium]